jgi:hypothetical protein
MYLSELLHRDERSVSTDIETQLRAIDKALDETQHNLINERRREVE